MEKVMLISSWYDDITEARHQLMARSPYLKDYIISHSNAVPHPFDEITVDDLYERISIDINNNTPEIVLLHTGAAYLQQPQVFKKCFQKIKQKYPHIKFGIEKGRISEEEIASFEIFEDSPKVNFIEELFFKIIYGRK